MTDMTLQNIRPKLVERIQRLAELQNLALDIVVSEALTIGVDAIEDRVRKQLLNTREQVALEGCDRADPESAGRHVRIDRTRDVAEIAQAG